MSWCKWAEKELAAAQENGRRQQGGKQGPRGTLLGGSRNWRQKEKKAEKR